MLSHSVSQTWSASGGVDPDLVAEVAAVAGPADRDRRAADLAVGDPEVGDVLHLGHEPREQVARARALERERADVGADLLDPDVQSGRCGRRSRRSSARPTSAGTRPCRGWRMTPSSMTKPRSSSQHVYWAWPGGHARMSRARTPARNALGVLAGDAVLVERARVEQPRRVADREVLELVRHLVPVGGQVARPVAPQLRLVERRRALVERGRLDHALAPLHRWLCRAATIAVVGRVRNIVLRCGRDRHRDPYPNPDGAGPTTRGDRQRRPGGRGPARAWRRPRCATSPPRWARRAG